jgi:FkbM family methyltransferase
MSVKRFVHKCLWRVGWDLVRVDPDPRPSEAMQLVRQLSVHQIDVIFDVGAHTGQFAGMVRSAGFGGRIVSFEPSSAAHSTLIQRAQCDANWFIAPRMALGDRAGTTTLNLAGNGFSSSLLPMLPSHLSAAPESGYVGSETVDLCTLDSMGTELAKHAERVFLKLDVQGFEHKVLQGAKEFLNRVAGIQLELSLVPLYEGESLFHPMLHDLEERGYEIWSLFPGILAPDTNRLLQLDAIFFRKGMGSC